MEVPTTFDPGIVDLIDILIPSGHAYLTGLALAVAHQIIIPRSGGSWLIGDDDEKQFPTDNYPDSGDWSVWLYNTDAIYAHGWHITYHVNDTQPTPAPPATQPVPVAAIYAAAGIG